MKNNKINDLEQTIKEIQNQPIFYLSLTSKELFHSNFLQWLCSTDIGKTKLRQLLEIDDLYSFGREISGEKIQVEGKNKTPKADLIGYDELGNSILVIENKVKDIPNQSQLENLKSSFVNQINKYVILSFIEPYFEIKEPFKFISYSDLRKELEKELVFDKEEGYEIELLKDYVKLIERIQKIVDSYNITGDYNFTIQSRPIFFEQLNKINFWENYQRAAGGYFREIVSARIRNIDKFQSILSNSSINHQKATINFYFEIQDFEIGIQLENNQFRRFIYGKINKECVKELIAKEIWFNNKFRLDRKINKEEDYRPYGSYNMKEKGTFYYQYKKDGFYKKCDHELDTVLRMIVEDLELLIDENFIAKIKKIIKRK